MIPPKRFDIFPPADWGMLRRSRCVQIFLFKKGPRRPLLRNSVLLPGPIHSCIIMVKIITFSKEGKDQPGKVANPARSWSAFQTNGCYLLGRVPWINQYAPLFPTHTIIGTKWL